MSLLTTGEYLEIQGETKHWPNRMEEDLQIRRNAKELKPEKITTQPGKVICFKCYFNIFNGNCSLCLTVMHEKERIW